MIYGVLIVYNDMPFIQKAIESIEGKVDEIVCVDGRFPDFPGEEFLSSDGTREYLLEKGVTLIDAPDFEVEKRNRYLVGEEGDWYLHLDGDEEWLGDVSLPEGDMLVHFLQREGDNRCIKRVRLFRHVEGLHYSHKHYWLKDKDEETFCLLQRPGSKYTTSETKDVKILHHYRDPEREKLKKRYYKVLTKRENGIREKI